jgi:endonuclease III
MSDLSLYNESSGSGNTTRAWRRKFARIAVRLVEEHGLPDLGNLVDPVEEIFYILLSAKTTEVLYQKAYSRLKAAFPDLPSLARARLSRVGACIRCAGLVNKRAGQIIRTAKRLLNDLSPDPAGRLRAMSETEVYDYLTSLAGVGPKSAFCVMMMSLGKDVFPVDVNVQRVAQRLGALPHGLKHYEAQKALPALIPRGKSRELHIGLLVHGRRVCLPRKPRCKECAISRMCAYAKRKARTEKLKARRKERRTKK